MDGTKNAKPVMGWCKNLDPGHDPAALPAAAPKGDDPRESRALVAMDAARVRHEAERRRPPQPLTKMHPLLDEALGRVMELIPAGWGGQLVEVERLLRSAMAQLKTAAYLYGEQPEEVIALREAEARAKKVQEATELDRLRAEVQKLRAELDGRASGESAKRAADLIAELTDLVELRNLFIDWISGEAGQGLFGHGGSLLERIGELSDGRGRALLWLDGNREELIELLQLVQAATGHRAEVQKLRAVLADMATGSVTALATDPPDDAVTAIRYTAGVEAERNRCKEQLEQAWADSKRVQAELAAANRMIEDHAAALRVAQAERDQARQDLASEKKRADAAVFMLNEPKKAMEMCDVFAAVYKERDDAKEIALSVERDLKEAQDPAPA